MHTFCVRTTIVLSLTGALLLSAVGCEDADSRQRDEVQAQLNKIRGELQQTIATGGDGYEAGLNKIVTTLASLNGGEPGQQVAKSLLAANALRELAAIDLMKASQIESRHRADLGTANARIDAALRIQALAAGMESVDGAARWTELQADLQKAKDGVTAAQARIAELDSPINQRNEQNQQQKAEIERLRVQVGDLLKKAREAGYSAGLETYKQASQIGRQADKIEYEVSNREIDLEHDLNPQHKMAETQKAQLEAMAQSIESAQAELDAFAKAAAGDAQASRAKAAELGKQVGDELARIKTESDGELKAAYEQALAALEKSASSARSAGGGGADANAAKMIGTAISESTARVHLSAAEGLAERISTLQRIKASNGAIAVAGVDAEIKELSDARQRHIDAAKTALEEASQAAEGLSGNTSEVDALRANLLALSAAVAGKPAPAPAPIPPAAGGNNSAPADASAAAPSIPAGAGAESAEALVAMLKSIKTLQDTDRLFQLALPASDPTIKGATAKMQGMIAGLAALDTAMQAKFSKGVADMKSSQLSNVTMITDAELQDSTEAAGHVKITDSSGKTTVAVISQVGGLWFIGSPDDDMAALAMFGMGGQGGANAKQMLGPMSAVLAAMTVGLGEVAAAVQSGEIATFEDAQAKTEEKINQAAQAAMGGARPGGGAGADPNK